MDDLAGDKCVSIGYPAQRRAWRPLSGNVQRAGQQYDPNAVRPVSGYDARTGRPEFRRQERCFHRNREKRRRRYTGYQTCPALALGFQAFLIMVCVGIYAVLVQSITIDEDIMTAVWTCMGYTVLLCFTLFKTGSLSKSIFNAH